MKYQVDQSEEYVALRDALAKLAESPRSDTPNPREGV